MTNTWLRTLDEINLNELQLVGGKAFALALLKRNGLNVPFGLVVTTTFFEAQIKHYAFGPIWAGSPDIAVTESSLEFLADFLKTTPLAPPLLQTLKESLATHFPDPATTFAVRSSALDEDRQDYSFAGVYLTELGVPRDLLMISLTRCWASALAGKSVQYRIKHGMSLQSIKIAVLLQPMLQPTAAGVGFTLNPITGSRDELVIEAAAGSGEAVVGSSITPYRYHLARQSGDYPVLKKIPGDTINLSREPLLSHQLGELAKTLEHIEAMMSSPQDVEWAYQQNELFILQTRPVTVLPEAQSSLFNTEWTRANYPETLPELPSPLFASLMERVQRRGIDFFSRTGLEISGLGPYLKLIYGRPYQNLSIIKRVMAQLGFNPIALLTLAGYTDAKVVATSPYRVEWLTMWRSRKVYRHLIGSTLSLPKAVKAYQQQTENIIAQLDKPTLDPTEKLGQFRLRESIFGNAIGTSLLSVSTLTGVMVAAASVIAPLAQSPGLVMRSLGKTGARSIATRHGEMLLRLGTLAAKHDTVKQFFSISLDEGHLAGYEQALKGTPFLKQFQAFLAGHGDRALYEPDMGQPRFKEQTIDLLASVGRYMKLVEAGQLERQIFHQPQTIWQTWQYLTDAADGLRRWLSWRALVGIPLIAVLRHLFRLREAIRTAEAKGMAAVRRWDLAQANRWVQRNYLDKEEDYFWLTLAEIERALVMEVEGGISLKPAVQARKESYQILAETQTPLVIRDADIPHLALDADYSQAVLSGTLVGLSVSPGQVQGVVKILEETDTVEQIPAGSILVTPSTDPALLPFFPLAAGLIVEVGGMLSHGSIIAREYGIPAVSNITDARKRLKSGDRVLLDGSTGVIQILEKAP